MKPVQINLSILLCAAVAALAFVAAGQGLEPADICRHDRLGVESVPEPRDMVRITQGVPFTVPAGKLFVLTALGDTEGETQSDTAEFRINGILQTLVRTVIGGGGLGSMKDVPKWLVAQPGDVIEVIGDATAPARAWGFLTDTLAHGPLDITQRNLVVVDYVPDPRDMLRLIEGAPFTVPPGKLFVLTALGNSGGGYSVRFSINGIPEIRVIAGTGPGLMKDVPKWLVAEPGDVIEVADESSGADASAVGCLTDI